MWLLALQIDNEIEAEFVSLTQNSHEDILWNKEINSICISPLETACFSLRAM
jgi:hypothetical protein